jgi:ankyrin repeat protein
LAKSAAVVWQHDVLVDVLTCYYADFSILFLPILVSVKRAVHDIFEFKIEGQIIMRGSSGIPKSDINSALVPDSTASTDAELKNSTEPYKRLKTRKPPLVIERQPAYLQNEDAKTSKVSGSKQARQAPSSKESVSPLSTQTMNQHTAPVLSSYSSSGKNFEEKIAKSSISRNVNDFPNSLALRVQSALAAHDLDQLKNALDSIEKNSLQFDQPPLSELRASKEIRVKAAAMPSVVSTYYSADEADKLLIRMIRLGVSPNSQDKRGNSILMHACKSARLNLVKFLLTECSNLSKDSLNVFGQNAATIAYKYGNLQLYPLLAEAGISPQPDNPLITIYLKSRELSANVRSKPKWDEYSKLLDKNQYMNLADANGQTLLFHAVINEDVDFVTYLCSHNQFPHITRRDNQEKTVLDHAQEIKDPVKKERIRVELAKVLEETGSLRHFASATL